MSTTMTWALRHHGHEMGLTLRNDGYTTVDEFIEVMKAHRPKLTYTVEIIRDIVEKCEKKRFNLIEEDGILLVRANQGHSIKTVDEELLLTPITSIDELSARVKFKDDIPIAVHGTKRFSWDNFIKTYGLSKMTRQHIHFATALPEDADGTEKDTDTHKCISGLREGSEVLIYLNIQATLDSGFKLYISSNGVILCPGFTGTGTGTVAPGFINPTLFEKVISRVDGINL